LNLALSCDKKEKSDCRGVSMALEIGNHWPVTAVSFPKETTLQAKSYTNLAAVPIRPPNQVEAVEPDSSTPWEKGMFIDIYA
jgi:hypothetical protein